MSKDKHPNQSTKREANQYKTKLQRVKQYHIVTAEGSQSLVQEAIES